MKKYTYKRKIGGKKYKKNNKSTTNNNLEKKYSTIRSNNEYNEYNEYIIPKPIIIGNNTRKLTREERLQRIRNSLKDPIKKY